MGIALPDRADALAPISMEAEDPVMCAIEGSGDHRGLSEAAVARDGRRPVVLLYKDAKFAGWLLSGCLSITRVLVVSGKPRSVRFTMSGQRTRADGRWVFVGAAA